MTQPLNWTHRVSEIAEAGLQQSRAATPSEREAIAHFLDVPSCDDALVSYKVRNLGEGRYRLSGKVSARLTQRCVVTLEPIEQELEERFDVEFWPVAAMPEPTETEIIALRAAEIEPIEHGLIDAGRIIVETLSAGLDPYPRKADAEFVWDDKCTEVSLSGPLADLNKLKGRH